MGLFDKKRKELPAVLRAPEFAAPAVVDYNSVLDWLTGLSDDDYKKVCAVAEIYRKAESDAAAALGVENEPSTFITQPTTEVVETMNGDKYSVGGETILDDDDEDIAAILDEPEFLETEPTDKAGKK